MASMKAREFNGTIITSCKSFIIIIIIIMIILAFKEMMTNRLLQKNLIFGHTNKIALLSLKLEMLKILKVENVLLLDYQRDVVQAFPNYTSINLE